MVLWPTLLLGLSARLVRQAVIDRVLLAQIALQVHVRKSDRQVRLDHGNEVEGVALRTKGLFKIHISDFRLRLDVNLHLLLDLVHVSISNCLLQQLPSLLSRNSGQVAAVDLPRVLALRSHVVLNIIFVS